MGHRSQTLKRPRNSNSVLSVGFHKLQQFQPVLIYPISCLRDLTYINPCHIQPAYPRSQRRNNCITAAKFPTIPVAAFSRSYSSEIFMDIQLLAKLMSSLAHFALTSLVRKGTHSLLNARLFSLLITIDFSDRTPLPGVGPESNGRLLSRAN
jgi:hypothetical protein